MIDAPAQPDAAADRWSRRARALAHGFALVGAVGGGTELTRRIGAAGSMLAIGRSLDFIALINGVAHAVVFGWLALWCLGDAWRALPARWSAPAPRGCAAATISLALGAALHALGQVLAPGGGAWLDVALVGAALEVGAMAIVVAQVVALRARATVRVAPLDQLVPLAAVAGLAAAMFDAWHTASIGTTTDLVSLVRAVQLTQPPLRDLELHGLACAWLIALAWAGVDAMAAPTARRARLAAALLGGGTAFEIALWIAYRLSGNAHWAAAMMLGWIAVALGFALVAPWRAVAGDATTRTAWRAACAWFAVSMALRLLFRPYQVLARDHLGLAFSHAYFAAMGQAAAVGFVAQALVALDARAHGRRLDAAVVWALNLGCALHVAAQIGTDWRPGWGEALIIAGVVEGGALLVWLARAQMR